MSSKGKKLQNLRNEAKTRLKNQDSNQSSQNNNMNSDNKTLQSAFIQFNSDKGETTGFAFDFTLIPEDSTDGIELPSKFFKISQDSMTDLLKQSKDSQFEPKVPIGKFLNKKWKPKNVLVRRICHENCETSPEEMNTIYFIPITAEFKVFE